MGKKSWVGLIGATFLLVCGMADAQPQDTPRITLTAPESKPTITDYRPAYLNLVVEPCCRIDVGLVASTDEQIRLSYPCDNGCSTDTMEKTQALIRALNTADLSTRPLWRRVFDRIVADFPEAFPGGATVP